MFSLAELHPEPGPELKNIAMHSKPTHFRITTLELRTTRYACNRLAEWNFKKHITIAEGWNEIQAMESESLTWISLRSVVFRVGRHDYMVCPNSSFFFCRCRACLLLPIMRLCANFSGVWGFFLSSLWWTFILSSSPIINVAAWP